MVIHKATLNVHSCVEIIKIKKPKNENNILVLISMETNTIELNRSLFLYYYLCIRLSIFMYQLWMLISIVFENQFDLKIVTTQTMIKNKTLKTRNIKTEHYKEVLSSHQLYHINNFSLNQL